ncbi:MAG TPA: NYN domain-containing protein, partial [Candidatus Dormibacteraeota bacterium]|nr:NYN domain-containing protein [Candidatus Dormibacteraeota bacterium]
MDFDNIRIGIRQHFGGELHPGKLMAKARKYGQVVTAKAYADFTGHPKEFQDKLLHGAGIEPVHAPSKVSGGRRQSSADMHIVIDMFLEAIDHQDVETIVLMSGDADFVRMVATLRNRFGRTVVISGVQSTSTALGLMNAGDVRDPITKQDCDMTGELGRLSRPLVTRADLDAEAAAEAAQQPTPAAGGFLSKLFGRRQPAAPAPSAPSIGYAPPPSLPVPPAPRRLRATELRGAPSSPGLAGRAPRAISARPVGPAPLRSAAPTAPAAPRGRGAVQRELPPAGPGDQPDEVERKIICEIHVMPPGRTGYTTMKTIEETLRSRAGQLGYTRKEVPARLARLEGMGIFKRETKARGSGTVDVGELNLDHPTV